MTSDIGAIADAIGASAKLALAIYRPDQRTLIKRDLAARIAEGRDFIEALLEVPMPGIEQRARMQLVVSGFLSAPLISLSAAELSRLDAESIVIKKRELAGLVAQGLFAKHLVCILEVTNTATK